MIGKERLKTLAKLKDARERRAQGRQLLEGPRLVREALAAGRADELFVRDDAAAAKWSESAGGRPVHVVGEAGLGRLAGVRTPQDVVAVGPLLAARAVEEVLATCERVVFLDRVQDPGNAGTIARTARALGVRGLVVGEGSADPTQPKTLRASAGALFHLELAILEAGAEAGVRLLAAGHRLVVPVARGGRDVRGVPAPARFVLVAGSEGQGSGLGARPEALAVTIPMVPGAESLNVAAACAVILGRWLPPAGPVLALTP